MTQRRSSGAAVRVAVLSAVAAATLLVSPLAMQRSRDLQHGMVDGRRVSAGEVLVKFRRNLGGQERTRLDQDTDADAHRVIGGAGVHRIHSRSHDTKRLLELLRSNPDVSYAEPNYIIEADALPDDAWFSEMWGLRNIGQRVGKLGTPGADISAPLAWDISTGSRANVVAVIDTGIDYTHPDLADNVWSAPAPFDVTIGGFTIHCAAGSHGFNAIANSCDPFDDNGHGSHVSGTIGAQGNNATGVTGINWTASLMASKFLDQNGVGTLADAIDAIEFVLQASAATGANVRVLSNSWSVAGFSQALLDEINSAGARNMLFVASAGNNTRDIDASPSYPASYNTPNLVAVASTDNTDLLASNSNWGATSVHLAAPGVNILSTVTGGGYQYLSGTSMAAPHVSGAAALVLSHCALSTVALKNTLMAAVDPLPLLAGKVVTGGRLNVNAAIRACGPDFSITVTPAVQASAPGMGITYTATVTPSGGMTGTVAFSVSGVPSGATAVFTPPSVTLPASSTLTITPGDKTAAGTYPMTISATSGTLVHTADVSYVSTAANQPPVAVADAATTVEDTPVAIAVLANDHDPEGDALVVTDVDTPAHGTTSIKPDKTIAYTPAADYNGPDTFNYTIGDGAGNSASAAVTVMVTPANDPPVAAADSYNATEDTALTVPAASGVLANDTDVDAGTTLTAAVVAGPSHGALSLGPAGGFTYTPAADYNGSDTFTYKASDGIADSNIATVTIAIAAVNDAPVANPQNVATDEDTAKAITLTATDAEGSALTYAVVTPPAHGTLTGSAPALTYTPAANYNGADSFTFKANDGALDSNVAKVSIAIAAVNDKPIAAGQAVVTNEDTAKPIVLSATDVEGSPLTYTIVAAPAHGTLGGVPPAVTYTPAANYNGPDSFTFKANDGGLDSNVATVSVTVNAVNDPPVANAQAVVTNQGTPKAVVLSATDIEASPLTYAVVVAPLHGTLTGTAPALTYTPAAGYSGSDAFTFKANDGAADSNVATVSITVNAAADPDFTLSASPPSQTVTAGANASYTVTVGPTGGFVGSVAFSATGLPSGVTASFNPSSVTTSGSSTLTLTSATATAPGSYPIAIVGTSGSKVHGGSVNLVVQAAVLAVDQIVFSDGSGARTTQSFSTVSAPETLIAFASSDGPSSGGQTLSVTGAGLTWTLVKRANTEAGASEIWQATAPAVLSNVTVKSTPTVTGFKQSLTVVTFSNAGGVGASAGASARTGAPTVSLTTTRAGSLVYALGNDWDGSTARTLPVGQTMVHQWVDTTVGDTFWLQAGTAPVAMAGMLVQMADTAPTTHRWNFAAVEIVSAKPPVGVPNVVNQTETAAAAAIVAAGLTAGPVTYTTSTTVPAGTIISQSPVAGTQVLPGTPVSLVASSGPPLVAVPDVLSLTQAAASTAITAAGLTVGAVTSASSMTVPAGAVISQNPAAGMQIAVGSAVGLEVSSGLPLVAVPDVAAMTQAAATSAITAVNLTPGSVTNASSMTVPAGAVISQSPAAGTQVVVGSAVALVVSTGLPLVTVPDVVNLTDAAATAAIGVANLTVGNVTTMSSLTVPAGAVISQNPAAGTQITYGSAVALVVSTGLPLVTVPDVVNLTQAAATAAVGVANLTVGNVTTTSSLTVPAGAVISQNPAAGTQITYGSAVALVVSTGLPLVAVPDVASLTQAAATAAIAAANLTVGNVTTTSSLTVPAGAVISESPLAGTQIVVGSAVALVVSSGLPLVAVPGVAGLTQAAASAAITSAGLAVGAITTVSSTTVPAGAIISQSPVAGTQIAVGSAVALVVSTGPPLVAVPNVVGATQTMAATAITSVGLTVGTVTTASSLTVPAGAVISQTPTAGTQIVVGSPVTLVVSTGLPLVAVPNVLNATQAAAMAAITAAGLELGTVTTTSSLTVPAGAVISQTPIAGTQIASGSAVALVVSSGLPLVAVPNVVNSTQLLAQTTIVAAGLTVGTVTTAPSLTVPAGAVISQNPAAGTQIAIGSAVALVVSSGPPLVAVPNVVNATQAAATAAITTVGLTAGTITTASSATVPAGAVISQNPAAGTQVVVGSPVALVVSSGPASAIAIDQTVSADGRGTQNARFSTSQPGELILAFVSSDGSSSGGQTTTVSGAGLSWTLVQRANAQAGSAEIWKAVAPTVLSNVTVTSTQSQTGYDQSLTIVAFSGASAVGASAKQSSATGAASATVTTTKANAWVFGVGNDWEKAVSRVVIAGQTMIHQWVDSAVGDTFWVQSSGAKINNAGTSVRLGVTSPTADRYNFAVVEIVP